jgi:hypothetical protein
VGLVWETTADRTLSGFSGGQSDASAAQAQANALGLGSLPIYFAVDFDATEAQQGPINDYFRGCAIVLGLPRVGGYGGFYVVKRALDAGVVTRAWQTLAWSGGQIDPQINIYQTGATEFSGGVDVDDARKADWGQSGVAAPVNPAPVTQGHVVPDHPVQGKTFGLPTQWWDYDTLQPLNQPKVAAGVTVYWTEAKLVNGKWWDRIAKDPGGTPGSWAMADADVDDGGFDPPHFAPQPAPVPPPAPVPAPTPPQPPAPVPIPVPPPTPVPPPEPAPPLPDTGPTPADDGMLPDDGSESRKRS